MHVWGQMTLDGQDDRVDACLIVEDLSKKKIDSNSAMADGVMHETMASFHLRTKILAFVIHHPKEEPTSDNSFVSQIRNANI
jgi:hypothetical protein